MINKIQMNDRSRIEATRERNFSPFYVYALPRRRWHQSLGDARCWHISVCSRIRAMLARIKTVKRCRTVIPRNVRSFLSVSLRFSGLFASNVPTWEASAALTPVWDVSCGRRGREGRGKEVARFALLLKAVPTMKQISFPGDKPWRRDKMPVGGRVAGKVGIYSSHYNGNVDVDIVPLGTYEAASFAKAIFHVECSRANTWRKLLRYNCGTK